MQQRLLALVAAAALLLALALRPALATDPYAFFDWDVSYITAAPLGVKQQVSIFRPFQDNTFLVLTQTVRAC
jgi:hypothetical protein